MSLHGGFTWTYNEHRLIGYSLAGISTSLVFPEADVCFDVAQGLPFQMSTDHFLITHGHIDHAAGIPYIISQKALMTQRAPKFFVPLAMQEPLEEILRLWQKIEDHRYNYELIGVKPDQSYALRSPYSFRPFRTRHRIPSNGYTIFRHHKKLRAEFIGLARGELIRIKESGEELVELLEEPLISFTGDTQIEFLQEEEFVRRSRILVMETTFVDERKSVQSAREWGHIHLDELIPLLDSITAEKIVLIHLSARYATSEVEEILDRRLPARDRARVEIFPRAR